MAGPLRVAGVILPVDVQQLNTMAMQVYGPEAMHRPILRLFERLQADEKLPTFDLVID